MSTTVTTLPTLVATFTNDRLGLCANVRELPESEESEVAVVDGFSGDVVVSRSFSVHPPQGIGGPALHGDLDFTVGAHDIALHRPSA